MHSKAGISSKFVPFWTCCVAVAIVSSLYLATVTFSGFGIINRLEWITYDWRVKLAANHPQKNADNLGFVFISDDSIDSLLDGSLGYSTGLYWHRHVYGRLLRELNAQGATAVGFDILLPNAREDHPMTELDDGTPISSDGYFSNELLMGGNGILAAEKGVLPADIFRKHAWALGDISAVRESDGILRRTTAFQEFHVWHRLIKQAARIQGFDLRNASFHPDEIRFPLPDGSDFSLKLNNGKFNQVELYETLAKQAAPAGFPPLATPSQKKRVWDLGIVLAARALDLDLENPSIHPHEITLHGPLGVHRTIPIDDQNQFYIDWSIKPTDPGLNKESIESLLDQERRRRLGDNTVTNRWRNKLAVVGSVASGNDLTDLGATPLEQETYLTSRLWNVANSILVNRFIQEPQIAQIIGLSILLCGLVASVTWRLKTIPASVLTTLTALVYVGISLWLFVDYRVWVPIVLPMISLGVGHFGLLTYKTVFEQKERRRVKAVFARIVSPDVVNELLSSDELFLGGSRQEVSVFFADIRGFTKLTDETQARAEEYVKTHNLSADEARELFNSQSQEVLATVNLYLSSIADIIKKNNGTLDKYIGDCVMAFWGAPNPNSNHAVSAVNSAIEAQRAIASLNEERSARNVEIDAENEKRTADGLPPLPHLHCLSLGTGINTGMVTVGLMGSHSHIVNYTVFGRDVNLASRLEAFSGRDRIVIGESTFHELEDLNPELIHLCEELPPTRVKGFRDEVRTYEVNWKPLPLSVSDSSVDKAA